MTSMITVSRSEIERIVKQLQAMNVSIAQSTDELRAILDKAEKSQVEPVGWTITSPDGVTVKDVPDYAFYSESDAIAYRSEHCFKSCNVVPLYTSPPAPSRVDHDKEYDFEREEIASEHLDDVIDWLSERGLYDANDFLDEGPDFKEILTMHEDELLNTSPPADKQYANYKRALDIAISHAKFFSNPFEFLCNQIQAIHNTEFSVNKINSDKQDAEIGKLVRSKLISGNSVPVSRCYINASEVEAIDAAMKGE